MKSIRTQILVYLMAGSVLLFSTLAFFMNSELNQLPKFIQTQHMEITRARADEVSKELRGFLDQITIISQSSVVKTMDMNLVKEYLSDLVLKDKHRNMTISNINGTGITTLGLEIDISGQEQYQKILVEGKDHNISQPFISPYVDPQTPIIIVSHGVQNNGETVGLVNIVVEIEFLNQIVRQMNLREGGYGWIVNREGLIVAHPDSNVPMNTDIYQYISQDNLVNNEILQKESGMVLYQSGEDKKLAFFQKIQGSPDWTFVISIPEAVVYSEINRIKSTMIIAMILGLTLVIIFSFFYSKSVTRPILDLKNVFEKAANGEIDVKADETVPNELAIAAKSFNIMLDQIKSLTYKDLITGLYNFNGFSLELPHKLKSLSNKGGYSAIAIISIDDFKRINSISSYDVGNEVLKDLARVLGIFIGKDEGYARFFGDEFILLLHAQDISSLENRIDSLWKECSGEKKVNEYEFILKVSIGVSVIANSNQMIDQAINQATIAKLTIKKMGGNNYLFYNLDIDESIKEEQKIEKELYHAVENCQLYLLYQPIIELTSNRMIGTEALLRWDHVSYGKVSPLVLIEIAEKSGLIIEIGRWVLQEACEQNKRWQNQGNEPMVVSVNVSALQFEQSNFVEMVQEVLREVDLEPKYLEIEITESIAMTGVEEKLKKMIKLKSMGVRIAIDDFGTGYSSLAYFTQFPIDTLKIDRSFINNMLYDENAKAIVTTIITMARAIQIKATAEGVESIEQLTHLRKIGCDKIQGYLISRPVEPRAIEEILKESLKNIG